MVISMAVAFTVTDTARATPTSTERNRVWQLINNRCHAPRGMTPAPTVFEVNLCRVIHRQSSRNTRRIALLTLRNAGALNFWDWQIGTLLDALARARTDRFIAAVRLLATNNDQGEFIENITSDRTRIDLVLNNQPVPLE
ncbi:MAG: hypothetical protein U9Q03_00985 [Patescibacteria group bacterium]|nr:hypothetical protein [Patescibacteria group bacterium]